MQPKLRSPRARALRAGLAAALIAATLALIACDDGEGGGEAMPAADAEAAAASAEQVVREWSRTLRSGDARGAAELFALPSTVQNGVAIQRLESRADALAFNRSLPCGARLIGSREDGDITIATFRLTERPGMGECGAGTGARARTAFVIEDGLIAGWQRLPIGGRGPAPADVPERAV